MITIVETSRSSHLKDFLSKISLICFIFYCSLSSFVGDSSQSSLTRIDRSCKGKPAVWPVEGRIIAGDSGDIGIEPVSDNPRPPGALPMLLDTQRCNQNMPKLTTSIKTATITSVAGERSTSPPLPKKEETKSAEIMNIGIVNAPEKADARAIFPRTTARKTLRATTVETADVR